MPHFPPAIHLISVASLVIAAACALVIAADEVRRPQTMWIMNIVWPITALFGSLLWLLAYYKWGRPHADNSATTTHPFAVSVGIGSSHCGAGCTVGDLVAEWLVFAAPSTAILFGWHWLFAQPLFAAWMADLVFAYLFGLFFQYHSIKPMRDLSAGRGILAAIKADTASIAAWQIGMYGMMAIIQFAWFERHYGTRASVASPEFWFAMQAAMLAGFAASYPVNWLLIRGGWKEPM